MSHDALYHSLATCIVIKKNYNFIDWNITIFCI